jgi:hypothetical protein
MNDEFKKDWGDQATKALVGKKIVAARYLNDDEVESLGWYKSAIVLLLDDGTYVYPSRDDEGNGAGALFTSCVDLPVIPVI